MTTLAKPNPDSDYLKDGVEFKICDRLPKTNYFARVMDMTRGVERLTGEEYEPDDAQAVMDEDGNPWGVVITRQSDNACKSSKEGDVTVIEPYSFTLVVMCDKSNERVGGGVISQVDKSNPCAPVVTMKHASGCNIWTANWFVRWYHANPWIFAAAQIVLGLLIATKGRAMFTNVMTVFSFFLAAKLSLFVGAHYEYMETGTNIIIVCSVALIVGLLVAVLVKKSIWLLVGAAGICAGFSLGALTFAVAVKSAGSGAIQSQTAFYLWCFAFAFFGGLLCCFRAKEVVMYGTALIGSYLFMHGWALLFGGLPDEVEIVSRLQQHDRIKLKGEFTLYLAVLIGLFVLSVFIQKWGSTEK